MTGTVIWITGLPQSGKSTLARRVADRIGGGACVLDSDEVRAAIVPAHGYDDRGRDQFYDTLARLAAAIASQGLAVLVPATANLRRYRDRARALCPRFHEVHVTAPVEVCAERDRKGLYADAPPTLPGVGAPYEPPESPDVRARGGHDRDAVDAIVALATA